MIPIKGVAYAHCDIPCGIYDPHLAQVAAHTVIRMTSLINECKISSENSSLEERKEFIHNITRYTKIKEEHAEIIKHEIRVIWGDYFKEEHLKEYPEINGLVFKIMKLASKARQEIDIQITQDLLLAVQEFAEVFYKTKKLIPVKIPSSFPTGGEIVIYK